MKFKLIFFHRDQFHSVWHALEWLGLIPLLLDGQVALVNDETEYLADDNRNDYNDNPL